MGEDRGQRWPIDFGARFDMVLQVVGVQLDQPRYDKIATAVYRTIRHRAAFGNFGNLSVLMAMRPVTTASLRTIRALARIRSSDMELSPESAKDVGSIGEFMSYTRFAIYFVLPEGPLADFGARWLGWDLVAGRAVDQPDLPGLDDVSASPQKYGFHGTLKAPFRLAQGCGPDRLAEAVAMMAASCSPATCDGLQLSRLGRFLALTPMGDSEGIARIAAICVREPDRLRAPATEAERARRRRSRLSARQGELLTRWGYPYVMEAFRFHMTLTGRLAPEQVEHWQDVLAERMPALPAPFVMDSIALVGERADGRFEMIQRYALTG